jgi:hydroxymethylpyrimidine/phosphomethylpyrimidine kinase
MSDIKPVVMTIAGSDSGGGAGIQADLKTFTALQTFGTTAITSLTSQNLSGVRSIQAVKPEIVRDQIEMVAEGFSVRAVKTGMLYSAEIIEIVVQTLEKHELPNLVVDPVFAATSGARLIEDVAVETLKSRLFPLAKVITPNLAEAEYLAGMKIEEAGQMKKALDLLIKRYPDAVFVIKGGHLKERALDLYGGGGIEASELSSPMIAKVNSHGSGCTFASAIAANLAHGKDVVEALKEAKLYIDGGLKNSLILDGDLRLIDHFWQK